ETGWVPLETLVVRSFSSETGWVPLETLRLVLDAEFREGFEELDGLERLGGREGAASCVAGRRAAKGALHGGPSRHAVQVRARDDAAASPRWAACLAYDREAVLAAPLRAGALREPG